LTEMIQEFQAQWHSYLYFCRSYYDWLSKKQELTE
jgi:hypothetical protein